MGSLFVLMVLLRAAACSFHWFLCLRWITFPIRVIPQMTFEPAAIGVAAVSLVLLIVVAHGLARWLFGHIQASPGTVGKISPLPLERGRG